VKTKTNQPDTHDTDREPVRPAEVSTVPQPIRTNAGATRELAVAVIRATREVFRVSLGVEVRKRQTLLITDKPDLQGKICGRMHLRGDMPGLVSVTLDSELVRELSGRLGGCASSDLTDTDLRDAVGEIINQVSGKAAILLADRGLKFSIGLPSFDAGDERCPTVDANHPRYALIFECLGRTFAVQLCVQD